MKEHYPNCLSSGRVYDKKWIVIIDRRLGLLRSELMKHLEKMILIKAFVGWFLGVISNGIGERERNPSSRKCKIETKE